MGWKCRLSGHLWKLEYPSFESDVIADPLKIWVCTRCGAAKSEGKHQRLKSQRRR